MSTIVEYRDHADPVNEFPVRIVSPPRPAACCQGNMETLGPPRIEGLWRFVYRRCRRCGYTVRSFYAMSWLALEAKWRRECPDLAHWRTRRKRREMAPAHPAGAGGRRPAAA